MSKKSVFCISTSRQQAERIVGQLKNANFSNNDISVLFPDKGTTRDFAHETHTKAPEGVATGAGTGGVLGGAAESAQDQQAAQARTVVVQGQQSAQLERKAGDFKRAAGACLEARGYSVR